MSSVAAVSPVDIARSDRRNLVRKRTLPSWNLILSDFGRGARNPAIPTRNLPPTHSLNLTFHGLLWLKGHAERCRIKHENTYVDWKQKVCRNLWVPAKK